VTGAGSLIDNHWREKPMKRFLIILLAVAVLGLAGCSSDQSPTQVPDATQKDGPPTESGIIYRGETAVGLTWVDVDSGLRVVLGADMNEYCAGIVNFDPFATQTANLPGGRLVMNGGAEVQVTVWDFLAFDCGLFTTMDPVASGTANLRGVDNDVQGTVVTNTNTWGWSAQGNLVDGDGHRVRFNGFVRQQFGNDSGPKVVSEVNLH